MCYWQIFLKDRYCDGDGVAAVYDGPEHNLHNWSLLSKFFIKIRFLQNFMI